ncbi:MAG: hypothetical protein J3Q66DRAFT_335121 [Benniella sp.]|nr:MAG: hypothetical protein J3Q66DRAFT_335121 [Benniella sp.]
MLVAMTQWIGGSSPTFFSFIHSRTLLKRTPTRPRSPMASSRTLLAIVLQALFLLVVIQNNQVIAQFDLSVPCNTCLVNQLGSLPSCAGVNLTDVAQRSDPKYQNCLCESSFDFTWTKACGTSCQATELQNFVSGYPDLLKSGLNLTCVKPTPSPSPSPATTPSSATTEARAMFGWAFIAFVTLAAMLPAI